LAGPSATIGNLARADGLVHVPAGTEAPAGAEVAVALL
jgi:molybdopterin biosynthesis enzyme